MAFCGISLSLSLLGPKRTWAGAVQMSASDPKWTSLQFLRFIHIIDVSRATMTSNFGRGASRGSADGSQFSAGGTAAEERVAAVRLESRSGDAGRHVELLQNLTALRIDPTQFAFLVFKSAMPELAVHPGDASHEAV